MPSSVVTREHEHHQHRNVHYPFWFGGSASCCAAVVTHPLDLVKVRLQTRGQDDPRGMVRTAWHVVQQDGVRGLYKGLSASLLRQATYSTTRFGVYEMLKRRSGHEPTFAQLAAMASTSGFLGGVAGTPADVLNVRMQNDAALPLEKRRNYRNVYDGLARMVREEGWPSLMRGVWPNSLRAALMTSSQLASYDSIKRALMARTRLQDDVKTHFIASIAAGFIATTICSPVDVVKTRVMTSLDNGGIWQVLRKTCQNEGAAWLFRGWLPSFIRLGPHTVATFMFLEQHKRLYRMWKGVSED